jgi:RHS repeat-associated protein
MPPPAAGTYRFGFNGKENDNEVKGEGDQIDYGMRGYDTRIGRWLNVDPLERKYPSGSPYSYSVNSPIGAFDPDGKTVYLIITKYKMDMDGQGNTIVKPYLQVIDITKVTQEMVDKFDKEDRDLYNGYLRSKTTASGKDVLDKYEQSQESDVYIFQSVPTLNRPGDLPGGLTKYDVKDKNGDKKFQISDIDDTNPDDVMFDTDRFIKIDGIELQNNGRKNSFISINPNVVNDNSELRPLPSPEPGQPGKLVEDKINSETRSIVTIVHEFIAHVLYADKKTPLGKQHDSFYGKEGGKDNNYDEKSDYARLMREVKSAVNKPQ